MVDTATRRAAPVRGKIRRLPIPMPEVFGIEAEGAGKGVLAASTFNETL
jgi:hypothetical protein